MALKSNGKHARSVKPEKSHRQEDFIEEIQKIMNENPRLYDALAEDKFDY